jgi:hypothetical protein
MRRINRLTAGLVVAVLLIGSACGGDGDDESAAPEAANRNARSGARDLDRFLMRNGEERGFTPDGDAFTVEGVNAFAEHARLLPAEVQQLRKNGFISFTARRTLADRDAAGVSEVRLFATPEGARNEMTYELRASTIRAILPETKIRRFTVRGVPGARGWIGSDLHGNPIGTVHWVQGRCMLVLVSEGDLRFVDALSTGARAIYERPGATARNERCARAARRVRRMASSSTHPPRRMRSREDDRRVGVDPVDSRPGPARVSWASTCDVCRSTISRTRLLVSLP